MDKINDSGLFTITVAGEDVPLRFALPANRILMGKVSENPTMLSGVNLNENGIAWLVYAGYHNACLAKDLIPAKDFAFFYDFVEESMLSEEGTQLLNDIALCYANSRHTKKAVDDINKQVEAQKKRTDELIAQALTGTTSNPSVTENLGSSQPSTTD